MEIIIHRVNKISSLKKINKNFGVEVDIRTNNSKIILNHDPFINGDNFINFLENYKHGTLVINLKESGIEKDILKIVKKHNNIKSFFLLDVEFPYIFSSVYSKNKDIALRFSEKEPIENIKLFKNKFNWVWIDCFTKLPINRNNKIILDKFKKCLVCPSRYGRKFEIDNYKKKLIKNNFELDAVMTSVNCSKVWLKN